VNSSGTWKGPDRYVAVEWLSFCIWDALSNECYKDLFSPPGRYCVTVESITHRTYFLCTYSSAYLLVLVVVYNIIFARKFSLSSFRVLYMLYVTSSVLTVPILYTADLRRLFRTLRYFMIYVQIRFHMPSGSVSFVAATKLKAKTFFYILQRFQLNKHWVFFQHPLL
jgi:hypothetical protein